MSAYALPGFFPPLEGCSSGFGSNVNALNMGAFYMEDEKVDFEIDVPDVRVVVKEAKIDFVLLTEALSKTNKSKKRPRIHRRNSDPLPTKTAASPEEAAVKFELAIWKNDHQTCAVRTLESVRQLYEDLTDEIDQRFSDPFYQSIYTGNRIVIPELPSLHERHGSVSGGCFIGSGFMAMQKFLQSYTPLLETWFRTICQRISPDDSPTLRQFLHEPSWKSNIERSLRQRQSLPDKLDCIQESDEDE